MSTVAQSPIPCKAYYAHLAGVSGVLAKVDSTILFLATETGTMTTVTSYAGLTVLGECGLADTQQAMDILHGSYAAIACARQMLEVA